MSRPALDTPNRGRWQGTLYSQWGSLARLSFPFFFHVRFKYDDRNLRHERLKRSGVLRRQASPFDV